MPEQRFRVLAVCSHPVQYMAPLLRRMSRHPRLDLSVAYCSLKGVQPTHDPDFNTTVQWDIPLLEGYSWQEIPNRGGGGESFWGFNNPGLDKLIREGRFDAVLCYLSYLCASFWRSYFAARHGRSAFIFGTDASSLSPRGRGGWKLKLKRALWPRLFSLADQVITPSSAGRDLMLSLGIPDCRITLTPYSVDNDWWTAQSHGVDRDQARANWGAGPDSCVLLFCAKLQPWKRPSDLLRAFAEARPSKALLIFAGEGPLRAQLETETIALGLADQVRFLGFVNQSQLPAIYTAADLMVLPSEYEPFAVVVNEAACCRCPSLTSDRVGAARDLVAPVDPNLLFPCADVSALAARLRDLCANRARLHELGQAARRRIDSWRPEDTVEGTVKAVEVALGRRSR